MSRKAAAEEQDLKENTSLSRHLRVAAWAVRSERDASDRGGPAVAGRIIKWLSSSVLRRYVVQKYPGSSDETGFKFGSARKGPLLWMMLGEVASIKQEAIITYADKYKTLVETGTFRGDMVEACKNSFGRVISIELSEELHADAQRRFVDASNVELLLGDSSVVLPRVLDKLTEPALFWLDAHYSFAGDAKGDTITPALSEVETILSHELTHQILIDDARSFQTRDDYPSVEEVAELASRIRPGTTVEVQDDIIIITQNRSSP